MDVSTQITQFADAVQRHAIPFLTAMAAVGVLTMALIQTIKDLLPVRRWFQRDYVRKWLAFRGAEAAGRHATGDVDVPAAERDLVRLATNGDVHCFYDLPIEQLCGQLNAAATLVLDYPKRHRDLLLCLASLSDARDLRAVVDAAEQTQADLQALQREDPRTFQALVDARARLMAQVQRSIDGLQIAAGYRWKLYLQLAAFSFSYIITMIAVAASRADTANVVQGALAALPIGIVGGFLAPIARDLVTMLTPVRRS